MSELIKRPTTTVNRQLVHAAIQRLARHPSRDAMGVVLRMVDEYAASQHTSRVYAHADKVVAQALIDADRNAEHGYKIFVCILPPDTKFEKNFHAQNHGVYGKNFLNEEIEKYVKNFFNATLLSQPKLIMIDDRDLGTTPGTNRTQTVDTSTVGARIDGAQPVGVPIDDAPPFCMPTDDVSILDGIPAVDHVPEDTPAAADGPTEDAPKRCTVCGAWLPYASFNRNKSRPDGYTNECRDCHASRGERYRAAKRAERASGQ